jgi:hypothetical protein
MASETESSVALRRRGALHGFDERVELERASEDFDDLLVGPRKLTRGGSVAAGQDERNRIQRGGLTQVIEEPPLPIVGWNDVVDDDIGLMLPHECRQVEFALSDRRDMAGDDNEAWRSNRTRRSSTMSSLLLKTATTVGFGVMSPEL